MKLLIMLGLPLMTRWEEPHPHCLDETVVMRRWIYAGAGPNTGQSLHNRAVDAERRGNLDLALELSLESYVKNPRRRGLAYIERLEVRISERDALAALEI